MFSIFKTSEGEVCFNEAYDRLLATWPVLYESIHVQTDYGTTHIVVSGDVDAPPLVLLHGMTFNSTMWRDNIEALSSRYRTYCVDTLGDFGRSIVNKPLSSPQHCNDWLNQVLDGLGLAKVDLIGHSMGGWLALNFVLEYSNRLNRLVLLAPIASIYRVPLQFMFKVYPALLRPSPPRIRRAWNWFVASGNQTDELVMDQIIQSWTHCRILLKVIPTRFKEEHLRRLKTRTLFLVGDKEVIYNAHKAVERVRSWLPNAQAVVIPKASHCLTAEQADAVNKCIMDFLEKGAS
ncbi:alpha/beta fold hydrolase [Paenibacillus albiflavus]|nr:alpha/beta hydrolase [Paenibacillus albiflavus]